MLIFVFFFKQKTAYEMRISDWSSDVCSSDLVAHPIDLFDQDLEANLLGQLQPLLNLRQKRIHEMEIRCASRLRQHDRIEMLVRLFGDMDDVFITPFRAEVVDTDAAGLVAPIQVLLGVDHIGACRSSEEHPSELQSLMRILYAVFCSTTQH